MKSLSEEFLNNYGQFCLAMIENDTKKLEKLSAEFNMPESSGLLASMLSGESWETLTKTKSTNQQVNKHLFRFSF